MKRRFGGYFCSESVALVVNRPLFVDFEANLVTLGVEVTTLWTFGWRIDTECSVSCATTKLLLLLIPNRELTPAPGSRRGGVQLVRGWRLETLRAPWAAMRTRTPASTVSSVRPGGTAQGDALTLAPRGPLGLEGLSSL